MNRIDVLQFDGITVCQMYRQIIQDLERFDEQNVPRSQDFTSKTLNKNLRHKGCHKEGKVSSIHNRYTTFTFDVSCSRKRQLSVSLILGPSGAQFDRRPRAERRLRVDISVGLHSPGAAPTESIARPSSFPPALLSSDPKKIKQGEHVTVEQPISRSTLS